jgi:hydroxyacylglutathione hydrolase
MLNVIFFTFNAFEENTYLLTNEHNHCWIIDPGMYHKEETEALTTYIANHQLQPQGIINTHAHLDHIFGVNALKAKYNIPFSLHEAEKSVLRGAASAAVIFGFDFTDIPVPDSYINPNESLQLGTDTLEVRFTPGHSPGSLSFYYPKGNWVISGDVLFQSSIGRTDLPGGNHATLLQSIREQLFTLPDGTKVLSGHGPATTIGDEKQHNPFVR